MFLDDDPKTTIHGEGPHRDLSVDARRAEHPAETVGRRPAVARWAGNLHGYTKKPFP